MDNVDKQAIILTLKSMKEMLDEDSWTKQKYINEVNRYLQFLFERYNISIEQFVEYQHEAGIYFMQFKKQRSGLNNGL